MSRRFAVLAAAGALVLGLAACGGEGAGSDSGDDASADSGATTSAAASEDAAAGDDAGSDETLRIGVAMPTQTSERWIADGDAVQAGLEAAGYEVDLQFANDDIPTQSQQIDQMITQGADALIIAAIDGTALAGQLETAASQGIPVIAYDRLIRDSENVDFYVTFDNFKVGVAQANALLRGLGVLNADGSEGTATGPFNIEMFAGSLDDNNAFFFWDGAQETLKPYIDDGTLVVKSGQTDIEQAATLRWQQETAQKRMEDLLTASYNDGSCVQGVLSPYDGLSRGIITALQNAGYAEGAACPMPPVTGQDAEIASVKLIKDGVQSSTIFKDTRLLAEQAVIAAQAFLDGSEPEANDTETYDNGVKVVPSYLLDVQTVFAEDIDSVLVESGYYTAEEVEAGQAE